MVQMINYSGIAKGITDEDISVSRLSSPLSLDEFDINIIDLNDANIWKCDANNSKSINCINDFANLSIMINKSKKTKIVFMFPADIEYFYFRNSTTGGYYNQVNLKDMISVFKGEILIKLFTDVIKISIFFENTKTNITNNEIPASFYFDYSNIVSLTKSIGSNKATTININSRIITSLQLQTDSDINSFLKQIGLIEEKLDIPEWISQYDFFDDNKQKEIILNNGEIITKAQKNIGLANATLDKNNEFKSILYTNGDLLVKVVFEILEELLICDLCTFKDEKKEDFLIKKEQITFIGEIKGVTSNVRSEHVSQLDTHLQGYKDILADEGKDENIKSILIINHQRNNEINQRQPVHENQITLAKRNGSVIIETITLLKLFEMYKLGNLTPEEFQNRIEKETGLLLIE